MPPDFTPSQPEKEQVSLLLVDSNLEIKNFSEYSFGSHFLTPADGFSFMIGAEKLSDDMKAALLPGAKVRLMINGGVQATGYIDAIEINASRDSGSMWRIEGRDSLAQAVDDCAEPTLNLKEGISLHDALVTLFTPFGWSKPEQFLNSNDANRDVKSNAFRAKTKRSEAKGFSRRQLREYKLHQLKPYPRESVYEFATRMSQRLGLWIWATASGDQLVASEPDFDTDPFYKLFRNRNGSTNVLEGSVKFDIKDQPTAIVADAYSRGGEFGRSRIKVILYNTVLGTNVDPALQKYIDAGAVVLGSPTFPASSSMQAPRSRILFLHDDESQTLEQLSAFVRREMAFLQRKSLTVTYTVEGHGQNTPAGFVPWTVDTTVQVQDELAGLSETFYVMGRTFNKSRSSGTTTHLELIRLHTLEFSDGGTRAK